MQIKLGLDCQVSRKAARELRGAGYEVVYHAYDEPDDIWINAAISNGATILVSPDLDIPNYLDKSDLPTVWIDIPQGLKSEKQASFIVKKILRLVRAQIITQANYKLVFFGKYSYIVEDRNVDQFVFATKEEERLAACLWRVKGNSITLGGKSESSNGK